MRKHIFGAIFVIAAAFLGAIMTLSSLGNTRSVAENEGINAVMSEKNEGVGAPEFPAGFKWINSEPLSLAELRGNVVLLDFWTYCCINCMHIIPDLKYLERKYAGKPFVVIGVHCPKFDNEGEYENVVNAVKRYGIAHPVVLDEGTRIWDAYGVRAWPTLVVISPDGDIVAQVAGEGHRDAIDEVVGSLLDEYGRAGKLTQNPVSYRPDATESDTGLFFPGKIEVDEPNKRLFVSDSGNNRILVLGKNGSIKDVIGTGREGYVNGTFEEARFARPQGIAVDDDKLYIADTENHTIRLANLSGRTVETIAGTGEQTMAGGMAGDRAIHTALSSPWDLELVGRELYIAMAGQHMIYVLNLDTGKFARFAGNGYEARGDGLRTMASFAQPSGIAYANETMFVADSEISCIRAIDFRTQQVKTLVGGDLFDFGDIDGIGDKARLQHPLGVAVLNGFVFVADSYNHKIRRLNPDTREITAFAGTGEAGYMDGTLSEALFNEPGGICAANGVLYVADTNNHRIRIVDPDAGAVTTLHVTGD